MSELTPKQRRFVKEYLVEKNATKAAIRAGYSKKTAYSQGGRLLKKVEIQQMISACLQKTEQKLEITAERIMAELASIGFAKMADFAEFGPKGVILKASKKVDTRAISEVMQTDTQFGTKIKLKLWDKVSALKELADRTMGPAKSTELPPPALNIHFQIVAEGKKEKVVEGEEIKAPPPMRVEFEIEGKK